MPTRWRSPSPAPGWGGQVRPNATAVPGVDSKPQEYEYKQVATAHAVNGTAEGAASRVEALECKCQQEDTGTEVADTLTS